jgi:hypothetical protein
MDRPDRHLELIGELPGGHPAAALEQQQEVDEAAGAHRWSIPPELTVLVMYDRPADTLS